MNIPSRYQVFDDTVVITDKDEARLRPHLAFWRRLAALLKLGINKPDLQRLVIMELRGKQRPLILDRLLARLGKVERHELMRRIENCLRKKEAK